MNDRQRKEGQLGIQATTNHQTLTFNHKGVLSQSREQKCLRIESFTSNLSGKLMWTARKRTWESPTYMFKENIMKKLFAPIQKCQTQPSTDKFGQDYQL